MFEHMLWAKRVDILQEYQNKVEFKKRNCLLRVDQQSIGMYKVLAYRQYNAAFSAFSDLSLDHDSDYQSKCLRTVYKSAEETPG